MLWALMINAVGLIEENVEYVFMIKHVLMLKRGDAIRENTVFK